MIRITATKNLLLLIHRGEQAVDQVSSEVRARFATSDKHQIYSDKRDEAERFLKAIDGGAEPDAAQYPYLSAETGVSAATMLDLAYIWREMDSAWKGVAALIEGIAIDAKIRIRQARDEAEISRIAAQAGAVLDAIGTKPPRPPKAGPFPSPAPPR